MNPKKCAVIAIRISVSGLILQVRKESNAGKTTLEMKPPAARCLLSAIQCLAEFEDAAWLDLHPPRGTNIDVVVNVAVEESATYIERGN